MVLTKAQEEVVADLNKALMDFLLDSLRAHGYVPRKVEMGDTYFIFKGCENSINEFRILGLPGWRFGVWIDSCAFFDPEWEEEQAVIDFFCQHDVMVDKFKPYASDVRVQIDRIDLEQMFEGECWCDEPWPVRKMVAMVDFVRMHPLLAWCGECDDFLPMAYHPSMQVLRGIWMHYRPYVGDAALKLFGECLAVVVRRYDVVVDAKLVDRGPAWRPRYELDVTIRDGASCDDVTDALRCLNDDMWYSLLGSELRVNAVSEDGDVMWT